MHLNQQTLQQMARLNHYRRSYSASKSRKQRWLEAKNLRPLRKAVLAGVEEKNLYAQLLSQQKTYWEHSLRRQELQRNLKKWTAVSRRSHRRRLQARDLSSWIRSTHTQPKLNGELSS